MDDRYLLMVFILRRHFGDFISLVLVAFDRHGGRVSSKPGELFVRKRRLNPNIIYQEDSRIDEHHQNSQVKFSFQQ